MARTPKNAVVVTPGGPITEDMILGHIVLFVVPDEPMSATKLRRLWREAKLDDDLLPKDRKAVNAFQVACRSVETRRHMSGSSKQAEVKVDEVMDAPDVCIYQITRLVRDKKQRVIEHPKAMRLTFEKKTGAIKTEPLERDAYRALKGTDEAIRTHFEKNSKRIPGTKVRIAVRAILDGLGAEGLRRGSGGVYFVPKGGHDTLLAVKHVLDGLYGVNADWHLLPCANGDAEREMVERHLTFNVNDELAEMATVIRSYLTNGKSMRSDKFHRTRENYKRILDHVESYKGLLGTSLSEVDETLEIIQKQLVKLAERVEE